MHTIPGYSLTEVLLETPDSVLLRGRKGPQAVLLRTPVKEFPTPEELAHLRYDGAICASLEERGGVRVLGLEKHGNSLALVAEDFGATPLRKLLVPTGMPLAEALAIARELARAVGEVHGCQVIHMAIEPSHVLVNLASHQVRLCGFGAASRLHRESPTSARLDAPEGLLAYVSPEQTGRMNRAVDYRTDLYSLGVTLYEMLTGQLPFSGRDALAMVHAHIATVPHPPHHLRPEIPPAVSSVVLKLLAKNAEDRYQSAFGLMVDLESCLEQLAATGTVTDFPPGRRDVSARFQIPQKLYGREREQAALLAAFERASRGSTELLLVTGYSGIGKSSLVNEIHKPLARQRSFFCSGKFDQLRSTPYGALIQAFQGLIRQLLTEREERVASWRALLSAALGANAQVVIDVIPELALILGPQPPVPALGPTESQSRFNIVFQQFMAVFTREEHPLTLFLDDLQWADAASLRFIQMLLADPKSRHLLVIGAYRNNEVRSGHPLMLALGEIRKGPLAVSELSLGPLVLDDVRTLLAETLACPDEADVHALAALVFEKTQGNPFFISQFLGSLYTRDLISFDAARGRWRWSMERIHQVGISDDVARLMAERLQELSPPVQRSLQLAACIGGTFSIEWLAVVDERSVPQMAAGLWEAVQAGLVLPLGDAYKYVRTDDGPSPELGEVRYQFLHDRVQEAAYALISEASRKAVHLRIGRLLLERIPLEQREAHIFELVHQLNLCVELVQEPGERLELARLNLVAGRRAKDASAFAQAREYLELGIGLLPAGAWEREFELTYALHRHRAECVYVLGLHDEADARFGELLTKARSRAAIRELYQLRMALIHSQGRPVEAIKPALEGLALFGIQLPEGPAVKEAVAREMEKLQTLLAGKRLPELARLPEMTDPDERERLLLLSHTVLYAGYQHPELFLLLALLVMNRTLEHGLAPGCGGGFVSYALALSGLGDFERAHEFGRLGMELSERFDSVGDRALSRHIFATFANPWRQPIRSSLPLLDLAYDGFRESGVMFYCALASLQHTTHALLCGVGVQETLSRNQIYIDFLRRMELTGGLLMQGGLHLVLHKLLRGMDAEGDNAWEKEGVLEELAVVLPAAMAVNLCLLAKAAVVMGDVPRALAYAARGEQFVAYCFGHVAQVELRLCQGLLAALQHDTADAASRAQHLATLESSLEKLEGWAKHGPANCRHKALLLAAERARLLGQEREAMEAYDASIAAAAENEFVNDEALASEHAARFYLSLGRQRIARLYLQQARHAYRRWGATAKVEALSRSHPELQLAEQQGGASRAAALDVTTVLRASQAISGEIVLDELLRKLMSTMLENAGAERGLLLLQGEARLLVEARVEEGPSGGMRLRMAPDEQAALATSVVRYVERTRERVVLDDAASAGPFQSDEYIARRRPKSVLCIPVLKQKNLVGVLYLENNLVTNAFTPERCEMLELLSAQAAISLENARLYETLDQRVKDKTQELVRRNEELSQTLQQLKAAQAQLVVQEKLASLGALTAGIAHELKNPLNFVNNFALLSAELSNELEEELDGQKARLEPQGFASIEGVLSDLKRNVLKINEHGRRANNIIQAMLSHSSVASGGQREVNLNDVVKEYAALAHQGLRSRQAHAPVGLELLCDPAVQPVNLSPQDLGRVILNLVNNACYAVHAKRAALGPEFTPTVRLTTRELGNQVEVRVWDNGTGIPAGIRDKIFHPFFTTKAGEGTGLGLSISHDIVVQGNGGTLAVESEEGQFSEFIITLPRRAVKSSEA